MRVVALYIDADACPVKDEALKVAARHGLKSFVVSNGGIRPYADPSVELVVVAQGADVADDWIAERAGAGDVVITNDIPLAARCVGKGARVVRPNGQELTPDAIGMTLATRDLMTSLRETGVVTGGPREFSKQDRSNFLNRLEVVVQAAKRG